MERIKGAREMGHGGLTERVYLEPDVSLAVSVSSDNDTNSAEEHDSEPASDMDKRMEVDADAQSGVDFDGEVDMGRDGDNEVEEDEEEEEDEEWENNELDSEERRTIGQGEIVTKSADDTDSMVDNQPSMLPEEGQEMSKHTRWPQPPAPVDRAQIPSCFSPLRTLGNHPVRGLEHFGRRTSQKPPPAAPNLQEAEAAENTSDVDMDQQQLSKSAGGDSLCDVPVSDIPLADVPLANVTLADIPVANVSHADVALADVPCADVHRTDIPLPDVPLPEALPDG